MNNYCKSIIIKECSKELDELFLEYIRSEEHLTGKNIRENLESSSYIKREIEEVLERYFD